MDEKADEVKETVDEVKAQAAEAVAPGSVTRSDDAGSGESHSHSNSQGVSADDVRSIVKEEIDRAMAGLRTVVPQTPAGEEETFSQPVRKPWTHRGGRD